MNERVHSHLDGDLGQEGLTPEELRETATFKAIINATTETHRSIETPDLTARIMARLPAQHAALVKTANAASGCTTPRRPIRRFIQRMLSQLWTPRLVRFRPVYGILAVGAFLLIVVLPDPRLSLVNTSIRKGESTQLANKVFVQFRLDTPEASVVRLAGSFTNWEPTYTLQQVSPGVWSIQIPLEPGVHDYAFVVDGGKWVADPAAPAIADGFGGVNSRLSVLLPNGDSRL
jgi:AMP-activated protein kinase-like protein